MAASHGEWIWVIPLVWHDSRCLIHGGPGIINTSTRLYNIILWRVKLFNISRKAESKRNILVSRPPQGALLLLLPAFFFIGSVSVYITITSWTNRWVVTRIFVSITTNSIYTSFQVYFPLLLTKKYHDAGFHSFTEHRQPQSQEESPCRHCSCDDCKLGYLVWHLS